MLDHDAFYNAIVKHKEEGRFRYIIVDGFMSLFDPRVAQLAEWWVRLREAKGWSLCLESFQRGQLYT